jgi:hypothetical protein
MKDKKPPKEVEPPKFNSSECGATHTECPNTWKGTCTRPVGHDGSHFCSQCNSYF